MSTAPPDLSIVLVTYNSLADLRRCLPSIYQQQTDSTYEVIVVDNHGHDGVAPLVTQQFPAVTYLPNPVNTGYSGGNNLGLRHSRGQWVLFLNPDTELHPGALHQLMRTARTHPQALLNPKLLNPDQTTVNACGNQMHYTGITTCRGLNEPGDGYTGLMPVPLLSGAALLAPAQLMRDLGGFDETYFMYFEDADLSLRARLRGYPLFCDQDAVITHFYRLGMNPGKFYYLERNRLLTLYKVLSQRTWKQLLPALLLTELMTWAFALRGPAYLQSRARGYRWLWKNRPLLQQQRQSIQSTRQLTDAQLMTGATVALPFEQLVPGPLGKLMGAIMSPIYRLLKPCQLITTD